MLSVIIRWSARILSILSIGILLLFLVGEGDFSQPISLTPREWIGLLFFPLGVVIGMVVAWRWEGIGSAISIGSLLAFYLLHFAMMHRFPSGPFFLIFTLPGFLFGLSWLLSRGKKEPRVSGSN